MSGVCLVTSMPKWCWVSISMAKWLSNIVMLGCLRTAFISDSCISAPVLSAWCRMRNSECPPSRCRSNSPFSSRSNSTPQSMSACICDGASSTTFSTALRSLIQSPAIMVSSMCFSKLSTSMLVTDAIPPCAKYVFASSNVVLHTRATLPLSATFSA